MVWGIVDSLDMELSQSRYGSFSLTIRCQGGMQLREWLLQTYPAKNRQG